MKVDVKSYKRFFAIELVNFRVFGEFKTLDKAIQEVSKYQEFAHAGPFPPSYEILIIDRFKHEVIRRYSTFEYHTEDETYTGHLLTLFLKDILHSLAKDRYEYKIPYDVILRFLADKIIPDSIVKRYVV